MAVTKKEVRQFEAKIRGLQRSANSLSNEARAQVLSSIEQSRLRVKDLITNYPKEVKALPAGDVPRLSAQIQSEVNAALNQSIEAIRTAQLGAYDAALSAGYEVAEALGVTAAAFGPTVDLLSISMDYTADLVRSIPADLMPKVNGELTRAALGGKSPYEAMQSIDALIGKGGMEGVSYQAERIVRTEVQRIYSVTLDTQIQRFAAMVPDAAQVMKKKWVSGGNRPGRRPQHQEMDGVVVPFNEPFEMPDGTKLMYPRDPAGPPEHTIFCGCQFELVIEDSAEFVANAILSL